MSTPITLEDIAERWLTTLQQDLKDFLHVVCDDQDLPDDLRTTAHAAVLYTLAPGDIVPDTAGPLGFLDDALALRVALDRVRAEAPERFETYRARVPELIESSEGDLEAFRASLEDLYEPFCERVLSSERNEFKGKRAVDLLDADGAAWLNEEITLAALALDFKPSALQSAVRRAESIVPMIRARLAPRR
ncbi:MAG: DUF1232 domain-containing protein [Polyangiales bacterium]